MQKFILVTSFVFFVAKITFSQVEPRLVLPLGHTNWINSLVIDSAGKYILSSSRDNTIKLWEISSGLEVQNYSQSQAITKAIFNNHDQEIISSSKDSKIVIWDKITGVKKSTLSYHSDAVNDFIIFNNFLLSVGDDSMLVKWNINQKSIDTAFKLNFVPTIIKQISNENFVVFGESNLMYLFNIDNSNLKLQSFQKELKVFSVDIIDSNRLIILFQNGMLLCYNWKSNKTEFEIITGDSQINSSILISNKSIFVTSGNDNNCKIWRLNDRVLLKHLKTGHEGQIIKMVVSPDSSYFLTGSKDQSIKAWSLDSFKLINSFIGHQGRVTQIAFGNNLERFFTGSRDKSIIYWDLNDKRYLKRFEGHTIRMNNVQFSSSNDLFILSGRDSIIRIMNTKSGKIKKFLVGHKSSISHAEFNHSSDKIVSSSNDRSIILWDLDKSQIIKEFKGHSDYVNYVSISANDSLILSGSDDSTFIVWNSYSSEIIKQVKFQFRILKTIFAKDDSEVLIFGKTNYVYKFDLNKLKIIDTLKASDDIIIASELSHNGNFFITSGADKIIRQWDYSDFKLMKEIKVHKDNVWTLALSFDDKWIYSGGDDENIFCTSLVDSFFMKLEGHDGLVLSVKPFKDNKYLVSSGGDHRTIFWDLSNFKKSYTILSLKNNDWLNYDNYNRFDASITSFDKIALSCNLEVNDLFQVKDSLYVPNLVQRIMNGENLDHLPKLSNLNICGVTPIVEPIDKGDGGYHYEITPRTGGVGDIEIYLNGVVRQTESTKRLKLKNGKYSIQVDPKLIDRYQIPGESLQVKVIAKTANNSISSRGIVLDQESDEPTTLRKPSLHAVMIGVDDYKDDNLDLNYAAKDANDLHQALEQASKKFFNVDDTNRVFFYNLTINGEGKLGTDKIKGKTPDKANINQTLEEIEKKSKPEDILLVFFAGHGEIVDKDQLLLLTTEATSANFEGIRMRELLEQLNKIPAGKRVLILDACHSGAAINNMDMAQLTGKRDVKDAERQSQRLKELDKLASKSGFAIITASSSDQKALELPQYEHGLMTYALLNAMLNNKSSLDENNQLQLDKWLIATEEEVKKLNQNQSAERMVPVTFTLGKIDDEVRSSIVLKEIPTVFVDAVINKNTFKDNLNIKSSLSAAFQEMSRGSDSQIMVADFPNAVKVNILYEEKGDEVKASIILYKENFEQKFELTGKKANISAFVQDLMNQIRSKIQK